jgi:hypothetical protein
LAAGSNQIRIFINLYRALLNNPANHSDAYGLQVRSTDRTNDLDKAIKARDTKGLIDIIQNLMTCPLSKEEKALLEGIATGRILVIAFPPAPADLILSALAQDAARIRLRQCDTLRDKLGSTGGGAGGYAACLDCNNIKAILSQTLTWVPFLNSPDWRERELYSQAFYDVLTPLVVVAKAARDYEALCCMYSEIQALLSKYGDAEVQRRLEDLQKFITKGGIDCSKVRR